MEVDGLLPALSSALANLLVCVLVTFATAVFAGYASGPLTKHRGARRQFYGEDRRHALKASDAYNGVRLVLKAPVDAEAVRERLLQMLEAEGPESLLRVLMVSGTEFRLSDAEDAEVASLLLRETESGVDDPSRSDALGVEMWAKGLPLRIFVHGNTLDLMAHHAVFDGVRGIRLLNDLLGNAKSRGTIQPAELPTCVVACGAAALARIFAFERPSGIVGLRTKEHPGHHESHYIRVPASAIKAMKQTHGLGFAASLQGLILWSLFRSGTPSTLHVASTVGFKSDFWARLGSAFNHYGAFPIVAEDRPFPQEVAKGVARAQKRNGGVSGFPCLLANAGSGSGAAGSLGELYKAIDVLIGGGPLVLEPACGYDFYRLFKFHHSVPIYILYVTICDQVDISVHSRLPLRGLQDAFDEGLALLSKASAQMVTTPTGMEAELTGSAE